MRVLSLLVLASQASLGVYVASAASAVTKQPTLACVPANALCATPKVVAHVTGNCQTQSLELPEMEPCCDYQSTYSPNLCPVSPTKSPTSGSSPSNDGSRCRSIELDGAICPAAGTCESMVLSLAISTTKQTNPCCETCSCYGDPHCESFKGIIDTWVLCDARTKQGSTGGCPITKPTCLEQLDHNGNQCTWITPPPGTNWKIGLFGSQCVYDAQSGPPPSMLMYMADDFGLNLVLGERAIITQARISSNGQLFTMTSDDCFNDFSSGMPWRNSKGVVDPSANWLPRSWSYSLLPGSDILWTVRGLNSHIGVNIRCTRTAVMVNGNLRYGPPRLNIEELIEPTTPQKRKNVDGFCVDDVINKQKSTNKNTISLQNSNCADGDTNTLDIAKLLCDKGVSANSIPQCQASWCKSVRTDWQTCVLDIGRVGWARVWCAANTLESGLPSGCTFGDCLKCVSDINDFGWEQAIATWKDAINGGTGTTGDCLTWADLPNEMISCRKGISIDYEDPTHPGNWITLKVIPEGANLCDDQLIIDSNTAPQLFQNRVRMIQCSLGSDCLQDICQAEMGFNAKMSFTSMNSISQDISTLVQQGDLVCNPAKFGSDTKGCLKETPPDMCQCASN